MNANIFKSAIAALALLVAFNSCKEKEETKFFIEVTCNPEEGTVTGSGEYVEGEEVIYDDGLAKRYADYVIQRIKKRI